MNHKITPLLSLTFLAAMDLLAPLLARKLDGYQEAAVLRAALQEVL